MNARLINVNGNNNGMLCIVTNESDGNNDIPHRRRSTTRHCTKNGDKWMGWLLDGDKNELSSMAGESANLAKHLQRYQVRESAYVPALHFAYDTTKNNVAEYAKHMIAQRLNVRQNIEHLTTALELKQAEELAKKKAKLLAQANAAGLLGVAHLLRMAKK